jgi:hypothetical protein
LERGLLDSDPGDYFKDEAGDWRAKAPNGLLAWLKGHHVEEHEDGTITVVAGPWGSNSILVSNRTESWHGYIERGFWRSC